MTSVTSALSPSSPRLCFGRTLARRLPDGEAEKFISETRARRGHGSVLVAVVGTEFTNRFEVEASCADLTPQEALDALRIASERIRAMHGLVPSTVIPVPADKAEHLRDVAVKLIDRIREFGWLERAFGRLKFFRGGASFRYSREAMVRDLVEALAKGEMTAGVKVEGE